MFPVPIATLRRFDPLSGLSEERLAELASFCFVEQYEADANPFRLNASNHQAAYLVNGTLEIVYEGDRAEIVTENSVAAHHNLGQGGVIRSARAMTPLSIIRIDDDLIDIMVTWSQIATAGSQVDRADASGTMARAADTQAWKMLSGVFPIDSLTSGTFANLPPAHISELLARFESVSVRRGDVIIREGAEGDYYYVIASGRAHVSRLVGGVSMPLADMKTGDSFGEEALIANTKRNASVTMKTDGTLLRLAKADFDHLLKQPLLAQIDRAEADRRVAAGAVWLDVRFPSEYQHDKITRAINIPLGELRHAFAALDRQTEYIVYCQSGRRSAAAAFLLAQRGYKAAVLAGGLRQLQAVAA